MKVEYSLCAGSAFTQRGLSTVEPLIGKVGKHFFFPGLLLVTKKKKKKSTLLQKIT